MKLGLSESLATIVSKSNKPKCYRVGARCEMVGDGCFNYNSDRIIMCVGGVNKGEIILLVSTTFTALLVELKVL